MQESSSALRTSLENLPLDICRRILYSSDLEGLRALVHASPVYHRAYLTGRHSILTNSFWKTLDIVFADAYAVHQSSSDIFVKRRSRRRVTQFLKNYKSYRSPQQTSATRNLPTQEEVISMVRYHLRIVIPQLYNFTNWALSNLCHQTQRGSYPRRALTRTEKSRLLRALYRFQLCCNLFGVSSLPPGCSFKKFNTSDIVAMFLRLFQPWEVEELCCIYAYAEDYYCVVFNIIDWHLDPSSPESDIISRAGVDLTDSATRKSLGKRTISRGLRLLSAVVPSMQDHSHLLSIIATNIPGHIGGFLDYESLDSTSLITRWNQKGFFRRSREQIRYTPIFFNGDQLFNHKKPNELYPPFAWTWIWEGHYNNLYGYCLPSDIQRWGYIFWDKKRLEITQANTLLLNQWIAFEDYRSLFI
ncbi:hypothetical protein BJX70DRAFT_169383 [Aspergillus crustosus]